MSSRSFRCAAPDGFRDEQRYTADPSRAAATVAYAWPVSWADSSGDASTTWVWLSLIPMGLGAWTPIYAGVRARRRMWWLLGVLWSVIALAGWVAAIASDG